MSCWVHTKVQEERAVFAARHRMRRHQPPKSARVREKSGP